MTTTLDTVLKLIMSLTWNLVSPDTGVWRNETSAGGGRRVLIEEYRCTPVHRGEPVASPRRSELLETVRRFNKRTLNLLMLLLAGRRHRYAVRLDHVGRRSGPTYATPVVARPVFGGFAIPQAYGSAEPLNPVGSGGCA